MTLFRASIICILGSCQPICAANEPVADRPNVLFIAIDDLNDWEGALEGHPQAKTPHLAVQAGSSVHERSLFTGGLHRVAEFDSQWNSPNFVRLV